MVTHLSDRFQQKLKDRENYEETVVKSCLQKYLRGDKIKFIDAIKQRVCSCSKRFHMASLLLSIFIKSMDNYDDIEFIFDQTFIRQLMLGFEGTSKKYPKLIDFVKNNPNYILDLPRHLSDSNIYSFASNLYLTNLKNSLSMNLEPRIRKFVKNYQKIYGLTDDQRIIMLYKIAGWKLPSNLSGILINQDIQEEIQRHREILNLKELTEYFSTQKKNLLPILKYYIYLNRFYESYNNNKIKLFNIVPINKVKSHNITIDASVLFGIMKDAEMIKKDMKMKDFDAMEQWKSILKFEKLTGKDCVFTGTINTDGITLCTHFKRLKKESTETKVTFKDTDRVIGVDPGRTNIFYGVEKIDMNQVTLQNRLSKSAKYKVKKTKKLKTTKKIKRPQKVQKKKKKKVRKKVNKPKKKSKPKKVNNIKEYVLTRKQYYNDSGINKANDQTLKWNKGIQSSLNELSRVSTKGMNIQKHNEYMTVYHSIKDSLWAEYTKPRWSRQRFRLYGGKKRVFAKFLNEIKNIDTSRQVKLAYGSAKFNPTGKGEVAVPTTQMFKECSYRFPIVLVDEYLTTKIHYETNTVLQKVQVKGESSCLRGLLWSQPTCKFVSRDKNAALNILRCGLLKRRPSALSRTRSKVVVEIGKRIKMA